LFKNHRAQPSALLGTLQTRTRTPGERRRAYPCLISSASACLSWTERGRTWYLPGRIVNICRAGAALITRQALGATTTVLVRLTGETPTPWVEAEPLGVEPKEGGNYRVRLKFLRLCPESFFKAAIHMTIPPDLGHGPAHQTRSSFDHHAG
jgi:hypothetical protein